MQTSFIHWKYTSYAVKQKKQQNESLPLLHTHMHAFTFVWTFFFSLVSIHGMCSIVFTYALKISPFSRKLDCLNNMWTWKLIKIVRHEHWNLLKQRQKSRCNLHKGIYLICWFVSFFNNTALNFISCVLNFFFILRALKILYDEYFVWNKFYYLH